jgi:hypothetical protein
MAWALVTAGVTRDARTSVTSLMLMEAKPMIYRRYLELGGVNPLVRDLRKRNIRTKSR